MSDELQDVPLTKRSMSLVTKIVLVLIVLGIFGLAYNFDQSRKEAKAAEILATIQSFGLLTDEITSDSVPPADSDPMTDKSFRLDSVSFKDVSDIGGANARITNISDKTRTAIFTISIFESDDVTVAVSLSGSAQGVVPGQTVTVDFFAGQNLPNGRFSYAFQVDMEY